MYKGTTPTFTFTLPETVDLEQATNVYVTFARGDGTDFLRKTGQDLAIEANTVSVYLSQQETLAFPKTARIQINWTYAEGGLTKRACSEIKTIQLKDNLEREVLA